ncbi:MAG: magnesium transporter [Neomegalonema sp.]|nr:magnesium transporter [Neomegalonema sp.]
MNQPTHDARPLSGASDADMLIDEMDAAAVETPKIVADVKEALEARQRERLLADLAELHAADIADVLEQLRTDDRRVFIGLVGADLDPDVLTELDETVRDEVLASLRPEQIAEVVKELDSDEIVYVLEDVKQEVRDAALDGLEASDRAAIEQSFAYPEYSAGRIMQREMVWSPAHVSVGEIIDRMRATDELPQRFYEIMIVDPKHRPVGKVALGVLMGAKREVVLETLMSELISVFNTDQPQEEVGRAFNKYHLISAPVVDEDGRLVGVITIDDAMEALDEEAEEDLMRLGGVGDESLGDAVARTVLSRFPWLVVNLVTAVLASLVIGAFDAAIEKVVALAVLMPIVASMGGNAGTQTLTVAVRALATKDLTTANAMRIVGREALVGLMNGWAFALIIGVVGYVWFGDIALGGVLAAAMVINMLIAGLAGILIPMGLERAGADPALASAVFVTTVTDVVGFFAFLGIAAALLT